MKLTPLEAVKFYYRALAPGRRADIMEVLDPHVVVELPDGFPGGGGTYVGLRAYLEDFLFNFYGTFDIDLTVTEFLDAGENIVALGRLQGHAVSTGVPVDTPFVHIWTVQNSHLVRGRMYADTACLCMAAGARTGAR